MIRTIKRFTKRYAWPLVAFYQLFLRKDSYLHTSGWIESLKRSRPSQRDGRFIPWMNYSVIQFLDERLTKDLTIFEFGSGYSSLYFAQRAGHVTAVEYDTVWVESIKAMAPDNLSLLYREHDIDGSYCRSVNETGSTFDIVIVDGIDRSNCMREATKVLSKMGVILLDDSERMEYRAAISSVETQGFRTLAFDGLKTAEWRGARTTIFYRDGNCLGI